MKAFLKFLFGLLSGFAALVLLKKVLEERRGCNKNLVVKKKRIPSKVVEVKSNDIDEKLLTGLNDRQLKIVELFKTKDVVLPSEVYSLHPDVSTRTLRRDMDVLVSRGFVVQEGSTRDTKYILKK